MYGKGKHNYEFKPVKPRLTIDHVPHPARAEGGVGMCYNQTGDITTLDGTPLKLVDEFTYLGSSFSSTAANKGMDSYDRLAII